VLATRLLAFPLGSFLAFLFLLALRMLLVPLLIVNRRKKKKKKKKNTQDGSAW